MFVKLSPSVLLFLLVLEFLCLCSWTGLIAVCLWLNAPAARNGVLVKTMRNNPCNLHRPTLPRRTALSWRVPLFWSERTFHLCLSCVPKRPRSQVVVGILASEQWNGSTLPHVQAHVSSRNHLKSSSHSLWQQLKTTLSVFLRPLSLLSKLVTPGRDAITQT